MIGGHPDSLIRPDWRHDVRLHHGGIYRHAPHKQQSSVQPTP
jgi:hypothetical protein